MKMRLNIILFVVSSLMALCLGEMFLRIIHIEQKVSSKFLMWSSPTFDVDPNGAVTFAKNTLVRDVAVYNDKIEYDMVYRTNNYGSADNVNYENNDTAARRFAFVGDSFTAGEGGYEWVSHLRDKLVAARKSMSIYNFSVPGAGFFNFQRILRSASEKINFTDVVIFAITDDLDRPYWKPLTRDGRIYCCHEDMNNCRMVAAVIGLNATSSEIIDHVRKLEESHDGSNVGFFQRILKKSRLLSMVKRELSSLKQTAKKQGSSDWLSALSTIKSSFPKARIYLFHLPMKGEVFKKSYQQEIQKRVESLGVIYVPALYQYHWDKRMFYQNDKHPNDFGYDQISDYVTQWLSSLPAQN